MMTKFQRISVLLLLQAAGWFGPSAMLQPGYSQIIADDSLSGEQSQVLRGRANRVEIGGGAQRGANLFHSFREFNVGQEEIIRFRNPTGVSAIFSRITGENPSRILGGLGVLGNADLYLINPNGILFGSQAHISVSGSFVATTASAVQFGADQFSAIDPQPAGSLLSVDPSALLFSQIAGAIDHQGRLSVGNGETIALLGGNLSLNGSRLQAANGQIQIGAVRSPESLAITAIDGFSVQIPDGIQRGDLQMQNATISAAGQGAGSISLFADNLTLSDSTVTAGANPPNNLSAAERGGVLLDVTGDSTLSNARISSVVPLSTPGNSGNIVIRTGSLSATAGTVLETTNLGFGQAGNIVINASGPVVIAGPETRLQTSNNRRLEAEAGDIQITAQSLAVTEGARLTSSTFGVGNAGTIAIIAPQGVLLEGAGNNRQGGGLYSTVESGAIGEGGNISIQTGNLTILNGAGITTRSLGEGDSGNISIAATGAVRLRGFSSDADPIPSGLFSAIEAGAAGNGGNIEIRARSLRIENGAQIQANLLGMGSSGDVVIRVSDGVTIAGDVLDNAGSAIFTSVGPNAQGNGGTIEISAATLRLLDGTQLLSSTRGMGDAGAVRLRIRNSVLLDDGSSIFTNVLSTGSGSGGNINLQTGSLTLRNGAQIATATAGRGDAGNLFVTAGEFVSLSGTPAQPIATSLNSGVQPGGIGQGGNLVIRSPQLFLSGSQIRTDTAGTGDAGTIRIGGIDPSRSSGRAETVSLTHQSSIATAVTAADSTGQGGDLTVRADSLTLDRSQITAQSVGGGNAGNLRIVGDRLTLNDSSLVTAAAQASGGQITVNAIGGAIELTGDSNIRTEVTGGGGGAGNIRLTADSILAFDDSDILAFANERGGQIDLNTPVFLGNRYEPAPSGIDAATLNGNDRVDINADARLPGTITLPDTSFIQNSLADLPDSTIDPDSLIANSCIARTATGGTFLIVGSGGLPPDRPDAAPLSAYPTDTVRAQSDSSTWQAGDPIVEPQGVYQLPNGSLIITRECL